MEIPAGSRDQIIVPDTLKITFNLEVESKDKTRSVVNNVGRALVKKKVSEDLIARLELNSAKKILLTSGDTAATYKISDIALEYDAIFNLDYAAMFENLYSETSIPYTKVTAVHHHALSKKNENWKIDINNLSVRSLQGLLLLFVDKQGDFANENEKFCNPSIKKILTTINEIPHQLYPGGVLSCDIFPEAKKYFYKPESDVTWGEFLTTKFGLWIDVRSSNDNRLPGSGRTVERSGILLQIERAADASDGDLVCYFFSLEDAVAHLNTNSGEILTIKK